MHSNRCAELQNLTREIDLNKNAAEHHNTLTATLAYSDYVSLREANQDPDIGRFIKNRDSFVLDHQKASGKQSGGRWSRV